jgi:hypothetical protein
MAHGIMRGQFMFNKRNYLFLFLAILAGATYSNNVLSAQDNVASVSASALPINVATKIEEATPNVDESKKLVSPSQAKTLAEAPVNAQAEVKANDFNFDLKMKSVNKPAEQEKKESEKAAVAEVEKKVEANDVSISDADLPSDIQYKANPIDALGNSILSQIDSDLFKQMSEIEKSTTLLTLELKREKLRNEIEAQKAVRQRNADDRERLKAEQRLKELEKQKKIEASLVKEQQALVDKKQLFEVLKQRKLLNAYMNSMLISEQTWLKEKEELYAQLAKAEQEKKELVELFKKKIDSVLDVSTKNIQTAETAKANFERIVKGLKARNEQLRKRVEADARIIKSAKNSLYLNSKSIEELKERNAEQAANTAASLALAQAEVETLEAEALEEEVVKLSSLYAILGITGRASSLTVEIIDKDGQSMKLKKGSILPTGHIVDEIGGDYAKFNFNDNVDYLYVGKGIDGLNLAKSASNTNN